jgi:hypothetical protein
MAGQRQTADFGNFIILLPDVKDIKATTDWKARR